VTKAKPKARKKRGEDVQALLSAVEAPVPVEAPPEETTVVDESPTCVSSPDTSGGASFCVESVEVPPPDAVLEASIADMLAEPPPDALTPELAAELRHLVERARYYEQSKKADLTLRAYAVQFAIFAAWCEKRLLPVMPTTPEILATYLSWMADNQKKMATIEVARAAVIHEMRERRYAWDSKHRDLTGTLEGLRRRLGVRPTKKEPLEDRELRALSAVCSGGKLLDLRDRAMLLVGWVGAFRRSEVVSLDVADATFREEGLMILLRRSKTDQTGVGYEKPLPFSSEAEVCPVRALKAWLAAAGIEEGALFRRLGRGNQLGARLSDQGVANVVKARCKQAGLDPRLFSGHSLRAGFATTAADKDRPIDGIMRQGAWKTPSVAMGYVRRKNLFKKNAAAGLL